MIGYTTKGGLGRIVPLPDPTAEQQAALADFFALPPARPLAAPDGAADPARSASRSE